MILAGLIFGASYAPIGLWFLAPISFAILYRKLPRYKNPVIHLFIFGLASQALVLNWSGKYVGVIPWLLLSLLQALFFTPVGALYGRTRNIWFLITGLLLMDEIRARLPFGGFSWSRIAYSQADAPYMQFVSLGGVAGLSAVVLLWALVLARPKILSIAVLAIFIAVPVGDNPDLNGAKSLSIAAVQGNTPKVGLDFNERAEAVLNLHIEKTKEINREVDLIVWPENASDIDPFTTKGVLPRLQELIVEKRAPILFGAVLRSTSKLENASILQGSDETKSVYIKQHLTPFGEYIPLRKIAEFVSPFAKDVTDFSSGADYKVHTVNNLRIGPIICYEIIDDYLVRKAVRESQALIVQTNSATFAGTSESRQQLNITRIRAAESDREVLSVSTVGISAFIDNNGKVLQESKESISELLYGRLHMNDRLTLANRLGDLTWVVITILTTLIGVFRRERNRI